ncbi:MAG: restriction endonuclease subunit S [Ferruginibacter sp.]
MNRLKRKQISELVNVHNNKRIPLSAKEREYLIKIYPYYGAQGIVDYVDNFIFDGEYILVAEDGENLRSNNQNICNLVHGKFWVNNHAHIINANKDNVTKYLFYNFNLIKFEPFVTGSAQPKLNKENLLRIETFVHDKLEQRQIASILSALDDKIELNNKINAELEQMAKTIYDYWFVQFDFPDANGKPYKSSGGKMVWNEQLKREVPEGWEAGTLEDIAELIRGVSYSKNDIASDDIKKAIPILRATNITSNVIDLKNMVYVPSTLVSDEQILKKFDILMTMSSGSIDHIGKNGFYYFNEKVSFGTFCAKLVAKNEYRYYLYSYMQSPFLFATIRNECLGTNINNLNGSLVSGFKLIIPKEKIIKAFNLKVDSFFNLIANNIKQNQQLSQLRDWLLPMLMNGQVTVGEAYEKMERVMKMK